MIVDALFMLAVSLASQPTDALQRLTVGVGFGCDKPTTLVVAMKNSSSREVTIGEYLLPWKQSKVLSLEAYQIGDRGSRKLSRGSAVADYLNEITLAPQELISGEFRLASAFRDFDEANKAGDILLVYRVTDRRLSEIVRFDGPSGVVLIPRKSLFSTGCPVHIRPFRR